ncbi:MAG: gamma-glutamyl-gamma-aminobutyrate hydrolase family protein [Gammaproteobacteria bacterium]|nr:gamma-glutamyl-gamma-aminobutyrate hydrolase family protein [Gammaproteobacteria bacterium]
MRAHYLQHVPFEGLGSMEPWLAARGFTISHTLLAPSPTFPALSEIDLLLVMGGPMSVNDEEEEPWLRDEKRYIEQAIAAGVPLLGVCLGAQLIAAALGARVYPHQREIGFWPIYAAADPPPHGYRFPSELTVFQWHGETFDLPSGATLLASSPACGHQAFQLGERVIALQFHLETTPASAEDLVNHCGDELQPGPWVATQEAILNPEAGSFEQISNEMARLLTYLTRDLIR